MSDKEFYEFKMRMDQSLYEFQRSIYSTQIPSETQMEFIKFGMVVAYVISPIAIVVSAFIIGRSQ